ncbi:MAG TPA: glycosyltransferase family 39 protein [Gaiella sp.]|nr:glycosyltransferase family 39 protein [Gaiella sp.]
MTRVLLAVDRALPYFGPLLALVLGLAGVGRRSLDVDEATAVAAAQGPFSEVVERALSDDPARAGYLALLQPVVARDDAETWVRLPSVLAAVVATVAIYRLGRRLAGRRPGAAASIILASSLGVLGLSRSVGPLALALAAMLLSSALFARAVERGNPLWWAVYAVSAALLPLTHPIAAGALVAQLAALAVARREVDLRFALPAAGVAVVESTFFLAAAAIDRADAADGAGRLELTDVAVGVGRGLGWNVLVAGLAVWGLVVLYRRSREGDSLWKPVLVTGLVAAPLAGVLLAGLALPVFPRTALAVSAGGACLAAGVGLLAIPGRPERIAAALAVAVVAAGAMLAAAVREPGEDWRRATELATSGDAEGGTIVVLPERARTAFAYYAPDARLHRVGRGDTVTVVVAGDSADATAAARSVVSPPRYALLSQEPAGSGLVVQRWVRP